MPLLDGRGLVFGRFNVIDAAALLVVCLLLPLVYGAYLLFKPPTPQLHGIEPARVEVGTPRVAVRGENLRPALRIVVGTYGTRFLLADAANAVLELPSGSSGTLPPGTYDVVLLDESREVHRLPGALTVFAPEPVSYVPPSITEVIAIGVFNSLESARAEKLWNALRAAKPDPARDWNVVAVEPPETNVLYLRPAMVPLTNGLFQVRAVLRLRCTFNVGECVALGSIMGANQFVRLPIDEDPSPAFRITDVHPLYTDVVLAFVRSDVAPEVVSAVRKELSNSRRSIAAPFEPSIESLQVIGQSGPGQIVMSQVRIPVVKTANGWTHRGALLRIGNQITIERGTYALTGSIVEIRPAGLSSTH
jgi:hypothetical protein